MDSACIFYDGRHSSHSIMQYESININPPNHITDSMGGVQTTLGLDHVNRIHHEMLPRVGITSRNGPHDISSPMVLLCDPFLRGEGSVAVERWCLVARNNTYTRNRITTHHSALGMYPCIKNFPIKCPLEGTLSEEKLSTKRGDLHWKKAPTSKPFITVAITHKPYP